MKNMYIPAVMVLALLLTGPVAAEEKKQAPAAKAATGPTQQSVSGKVVESLSGAGYTYLLVENDQGKVWAAIPESKVEVGQEIIAQPGMVMQSFESKALGRTFDRIVFSPGLVQADATAAARKSAQGHLDAPVNDTSLAALSGGSSRAVVPADTVKVEKAEGSQARTVAECFEQAETLDRQTVRVRGKVVKFSPEIMGKNWIHIQDGSGNPTKKTHDLVVTSLENVTKDSVVTVEGMLYKDKNFGAGYKYAVIVEDAKIIR